MKKIIYLNFLKETSVFFLVSSIAVTIIVWVIQAVNYLEFVTEDGHSFQIYFYYTLLSLPKIYNKLLPFMFFFSIFFTLIKYEEQNQTLIFWTNGISKINFLKVILIFSIFFLILNFVFSLSIVPNSQDKARSYIRKSNIDYLPFLIKPKKFIDTVEKLTIFVDKKNQNLLENIIIKEKIKDNQSQIIVAKDGEIINRENGSQKIVLNDGKIINTENNNQNIIDFSKFTLDLSKFDTNTITNQKTQEMKTFDVIRCIRVIENYKKTNRDNENKNFFKGCASQIFPAISEEFLKRFFAPIFIILVGLSSSLIITSSKDNQNYK